jgi:hypothetical protein
VQAGHRYIEAEPKTEKRRRSIALAPMVVELLKQRHLRQGEAKLQAGAMWQERGLVFCAALGTPLNPSKVVDRFKTLLVQLQETFCVRNSASSQPK